MCVASSRASSCASERNVLRLGNAIVSKTFDALRFRRIRFCNRFPLVPQCEASEASFPSDIKDVPSAQAMRNFHIVGNIHTHTHTYFINILQHIRGKKQ